jgi:hypothetical protein
VLHPVGRQSIELGQTQLQGMKSENIRHSQVDLGTLPR